jgi:hypothetical protein
VISYDMVSVMLLLYRVFRRAECVNENETLVKRI